jgi:hypothetical protein
MDKVINVRLPMAEKVALQQMAFQAGLSLSALVRRCCWGRKVVTDPALGIMEYLRRGSEEIRAAHLHAGDQIRARVHTEAALRWLRDGALPPRALVYPFPASENDGGAGHDCAQ